MKKPLIAAILSFFFPGLGQVYAGKFDRGLVMMAATAVFTLLYGILALILESSKGNIWHWAFRNLVNLRGFTGGDFLSIIIIVTVLWALQIYDAYQIAKSNQGILKRLRKK